MKLKLLEVVFRQQQLKINRLFTTIWEFFFEKKLHICVNCTCYFQIISRNIIWFKEPESCRSEDFIYNLLLKQHFCLQKDSTKKDASKLLTYFAANLVRFCGFLEQIQSYIKCTTSLHLISQSISTLSLNNIQQKLESNSISIVPTSSVMEMIKSWYIFFSQCNNIPCSSNYSAESDFRSSKYLVVQLHDVSI